MTNVRWSEESVRIGRDKRMQPGHVYLDPLDGDKRRFWRWAEPDTATGISMPINNNKTPQGGPPSCPWTANNCGLFDEIFSFHSGGAFVLLADGAVRFLSENLDLTTYRALLTPKGGGSDRGVLTARSTRGFRRGRASRLAHRPAPR